jgi:hypothetical protein
MANPNPPLTEKAKKSVLVREFPDVVLAGQLADEMEGLDPIEFFRRFRVDYQRVKMDGFRPIFLALANSGGGEAAESFGLFEKPGKKGAQLFEVSGSESSMWEFDGQWDPDLTTPAVLWHRLTAGKLGMQDGQWDVFNSALKRWSCAWPRPLLSSRSRRPQARKHRARKSRAAERGMRRGARATRRDRVRDKRRMRQGARP